MSDPVHSLILGPSTCGKSSLAFTLAANARRVGTDVMALDVKLDARWQVSRDPSGRPYLTDDAERFLWWAKRAKRCALFVDEAAEGLDRDPKFNWLTSQARAWGHHTYVITQFYTDVRPALRINCDEVFAFRQDPDSAIQLARRFTDETMRAASNLRQYEFLHKRPFEPAKLRKLQL